MAKPEKQTKRDPSVETRFTKDQLVGSKTISLSKDAVAAVLKDEETYTKEEAETLVLQFLKGKV